LQKSFSSVLKKAYLKKAVDKEKFTLFLEKLKYLKENLNPEESEEFNKNIIKKFLEFEYDEINTYERVDLAIYENKKVEVIIETKTIKNTQEMITSSNFLKKSFFEITLYFLRETIKNKNHYLKHLIVTNGIEWYIFDAVDFNKIIPQKLKKLYIDFEVTPKLFKTTTKEFYEIIKENLPLNINEKLDFVYISFDKDYSTNQLIQIYKILKKEHLLKKFNLIDANKLNKNFYYELLYIIGLEEKKEKNKKILIKSSTKGTLLDSIYQKLKTEFNIENFEIALNLAITWINRILFLKLFEARMLEIDKNFKRFLDYEVINEFDKLNTLFFEVLAQKERSENEFNYIPYINSSLFEVTELEKKYLRISNLKDNTTLKIYKKSILKEKELNTLEYLLKFLNAYDFSSDEESKFKEDRLINSSVLGLIFEKINGYKEGSYYTPSKITTYIVKEALQKRIIDKFNEEFNLEIKDFEELKEYSKREFYKKEFQEKANKLIDEIKIVDPAVGSGHFLVSALNELIVIKNELNLFLNELEIVNENDELYFIYRDGEVFKYTKNCNKKVFEIQKAIFQEKKKIIENQLFGVDINKNSAAIARLRLWIELLKSCYFEGDELITLPNIDINIKVGNSLVSRFNNLKVNFKVNEYKEYVFLYKETNDKEIKKELIKKLNEIKNILKENLKKELLEYKELARLLKIYKDVASEEELSRLDNELIIIALKSKESYQKDLFESVDKEKILNKINELFNKLKEKELDTFEWIIEFPEVLNEKGEFIGFDIVLANPPYIRQEEIKIKELLKNYKIYHSRADIYAYFYELGINILKDKGILGYITSNKFFRAAYGENLREFLKPYIYLINDFNGKRIFDEATVDVAVIFAKKEKSNKLIYLKDKEKIEVDKKTFTIYSFLSEKELKLKKQIEKIGTPLKEWDIKINYGIKTGLNEAFIIDEGKKEELIKKDKKSIELIKPLLRGRDIKKWGYEWKELYVIVVKYKFANELIKNFSAIYKYLKKFEDKLKNRGQVKNNQHHWLELDNNPKDKYLELFEREKIVWQRVTREPTFAIVDKGFYILDSMAFLIGDNLKYLLAFLNSKIIARYIDLITHKYGETGFLLSNQFVEQLPIPKPENIDKNEYQKIISLVDEILDGKDKEDELEEVIKRVYGIENEKVVRGRIERT